MPSITSSFKRELFKQNFRNVGWISILYLVGLLFTLPLQLAMALSKEYVRNPYGSGLFDHTFFFEFQSLFLFTIPVLMAVFLLRYLQVSASSDFMHSLPIRREALFRHQIGSGIFMLLTPILFTSIIMFLFYIWIDVSDFYTLGDLGYWMLVTIIVTLLVFIASVFVGTLTGLSAVQGVLTYILLLFPAGIYILIAFHVSYFTVGYAETNGLDHTFEHFSPITDVLMTNQLEGQEVLPVGYLTLAIYFVISIVLYYIAMIIYKKRPLESATQAIALHSLKPVLKFSMTFCFALFVGMYFGETQSSISWIIGGYLLGIIIGYLLATMLIAKTWRVFTFEHAKGILVYGIAASLIASIIPVFWQKYESYVPPLDEVDYVYIGDTYYEYEDAKLYNESLSFIRSDETINAIRTLHEEFIQQGDPLNRSGKYYFISYKMKSGEEVQRSYRMNPKEINSELKAVWETEDYKKLAYPLMNLDPSNVQKINIHPHGPGNAEAVIVDPAKMKEFFSHMKSDINALSFEEMNNPVGLQSYVSVTLDNEKDRRAYAYQRNTMIPTSYENTTKWLKGEDLYDIAFTSVDEIDHMKVYSMELSENQYPEDVYHQMMNGDSSALTERHLEVTDEKQIEEALKGQQSASDGKFVVGIHYDDDDDFFDVLSFNEENAPDFIKDYFEDVK
ncbi:DUF6449 domain-containing protein [Guptibacillus hwajinpoensis]|uniref:ABC-2 type transport system permease protein n=1 Tax=Guptibacillus hwajinpoensis TaxID=208199 RepID=A0ABU0JXP5_9BACL|nr:DUF6449 domain-containing protein [Alkalihalobacillus hemicentroti]MDQ0481852.1 ABC-2 type transport system permease protein [Alkalihalobacillus hemicentroti]